MSYEYIVYNNGGAIVALFLFLGLIAILAVCSPGKSRKYRHTLVDLYVAAKVRAIAAKENLDLVKEYESFKKFLKKQRLEDKDLDQAIEEELKDKLVEGEKDKGK